MFRTHNTRVLKTGTKHSSSASFDLGNVGHAHVNTRGRTKSVGQRKRHNIIILKSQLTKGGHKIHHKIQ